jgi:hypothetical protein
MNLNTISLPKPIHPWFMPLPIRGGPKWQRTQVGEKIILVANEVSEHAPMMGPTFFLSWRKVGCWDFFVVPNVFS